MIVFRKATMQDVDSIEQIYEEILTKEEDGEVYTNWKRNVYPIRQTAVDAVNADTMYVEEEDDVIVAAANLNQLQLPEYDKIPWNVQADPEEVFVIHTLVVSPKNSRKGYAKNFVKYSIALAKDRKYKTIRLDTYEGNLPACNLYTSLGFQYAGATDFDFHSIPEVLKCFDYEVL